MQYKFPTGTGSFFVHLVRQLITCYYADFIGEFDFKADLRARARTFLVFIQGFKYLNWVQLFNCIIVMISLCLMRLMGPCICVHS